MNPPAEAAVADPLLHPRHRELLEGAWQSRLPSHVQGHREGAIATVAIPVLFQPLWP